MNTFNDYLKFWFAGVIVFIIANVMIIILMILFALVITALSL